MELYTASPASAHLAPAPRAACEAEVRVYLKWLAGVRGVAIPSDASYGPAGIYSKAADGYVVPMPGYGAQAPVTCELLDDAGEVVRRMVLPADKRGKLPMTAAQAKEWTGLSTVRAPRRKAAAAAAVVVAVAPEHASSDAPASVVTPEPVVTAEEASMAVSEPVAPPCLAAADVLALEALEAAGFPPIGEPACDAVWFQYVAHIVGATGPKAWHIETGRKQADRKARNRGVVLISPAVYSGLLDRFHALPPFVAAAAEVVDAAPELTPEVTPQAEALPAAAPAPVADDLAATVAALAARLAKLEARAVAGGRPARTDAHAAAIRRAWAMRRAMRERADLDRRALLVVNADNRALSERLQQVEAERSTSRAAADQAMRNEAAAREAARLSARDAMDSAANADTLRDELTAAETALARARADAAADRAELQRLAPVVAALAALNPTIQPVALAAAA